MIEEITTVCLVNKKREIVLNTLNFNNVKTWIVTEQGIDYFYRKEFYCLSKALNYFNFLKEN